MTTLSKRYQFVIGCILVALMVATRGYHFPTVKTMLPSASWAVFFLAGIYLRAVWLPGLLMALAVGLDYIAITIGGVSAFCVSPAYAALLPAYASLWFAGRWYQSRCGLMTIAPLPLIASVSTGALLCEIISSGSFYVFSGRFAAPTFVEFADRFNRYFPSSLISIAVWVGIATVLHGVVLAARGAPIFSMPKR